MIRSALMLFALRILPWSHFEFARWHGVVAITLAGLLGGVEQALLRGWIEVVVGLLLSWVGFLVMYGVLRLWMKRDERWNGQGQLFNLLAACWLVVNVLGGGLMSVPRTGLLWSGSVIFWLPMFWLLRIYALWVMAKALSGAILKASIGYSTGGVVVASVLAILAARSAHIGLYTLMLAWSG